MNIIRWMKNMLAHENAKKYGSLALLLCIGLGGYCLHNKCKRPAVQREDVVDAETLKKEIHDDGAIEVLASKLTATEQRLSSIENKLDDLAEKQQAAQSANVAERVKSEVSRQVAQIKDVKSQKKKVLHKLLAEVADDNKS